MRDLYQIAHSLSEGERRTMRSFEGPEPPFGHGWGVALLIAKGLLDWRKKWWIAGSKVLVITRQGRKVRRILNSGWQNVPPPRPEGARVPPRPQR